MRKELEVLKQRGYFVKVQRTEPGRYVASYPPNSIFEEKIDAFTTDYEIGPDHLGMDGCPLVLPRYAYRSAILADIHCQCRHLDINTDLVVYCDEEGKETDDINLFQVTLSDQEVRQEKTLNALIQREKVEDQELVKQVFRTFKMMVGLSV